MAGQSEIVEIGWQKVDPDGSTCEICGEQCFLTMHQAFYTTGSSKQNFMEVYLCMACFDEMEELDKDES